MEKDNIEEYKMKKVIQRMSAIRTARTIKITIVGSKQPGNYNVSSLATVYNALHLGGGPSKNGSYRNIELIRNNKIIKNIFVCIA